MESIQSLPRLQQYLMVHNIGSDIIKSDIFKRGNQQVHHKNTTVVAHSISVAMVSVNIATHLQRMGIHVDMTSLIRAALLHDIGLIGVYDGSFHCLRQHPRDSVKLAPMFGELNNIEKNAIRAHMFPLCFSIPKYRESWIITIADKICYFSEVSAHNHYQQVRATHIYGVY